MHASADDREPDKTAIEQRILEGSLLKRLWIALRSGIALARDPSDTEQVLLFSTALDGARIARVRHELEARPDGRTLLRLQPRIDSSQVDYAWLRTLPGDSIGGAYVRMLAAQQLDPDLFQHAPGLSSDLVYVGRRIRQTHDLCGVDPVWWTPRNAPECARSDPWRSGNEESLQPSSRRMQCGCARLVAAA